jgi:hypothetical protein
MPRKRLEMELIMSRRIATFAFLMALVLSLRWGSAAPQPEARIDVYFSPKGGCAEAVVREVDTAPSDGGAAEARPENTGGVVLL